MNYEELKNLNFQNHIFILKHLYTKKKYLFFHRFMYVFEINVLKKHKYFVSIFKHITILNSILLHYCFHNKGRYIFTNISSLTNNLSYKSVKCITIVKALMHKIYFLKSFISSLLCSFNIV